jgi:tight adherence protein C
MIPLGQILISLIVAGATFLLVWSLFRVPVQAQPPLHQQLAIALGARRRQTLFEAPWSAAWLQWYLNIARRLQSGALRNLVRRDLNASGNPSGYSIEEYIALCLACATGFGVVATFLVFLTTGSFSLLTLLGTAILGFGTPLWTMRQAADARVLRIGRQLPYTMDLVALMMAAGSTFTEAIDTLIRDSPEEDLNEELRIVLSEIEFGSKRATALANMADRIPLDTLRSVIGAVNQAEALGTPLAEILKNQATMMRMHRSVRAEKLAASASLRILFPSMFILMAVVIVVFGPTLILPWLRGGLTPGLGG